MTLIGLGFFCDRGLSVIIHIKFLMFHEGMNLRFLSDNIDRRGWFEE